MRPDYAEFECIIGMPAVGKPKDDTGWLAMPSESSDIILVPGGTVSAKVTVERTTSPRTTAKLFGSTFDVGVTLAFVPATVVVDARIGSRAIVEMQATTALGVVANGSIDVWAEDA